MLMLKMPKKSNIEMPIENVPEVKIKNGRSSVPHHYFMHIPNI